MLHRGKSIGYAIILTMIQLTVVAQEPLNRVRITTQDAKTTAHALEIQGFDILQETGDAVDLAVSREEWDALIALGHTPQFIEKGRPFNQIQAERGVAPVGYPDLDGVIAEMQATADNFPGIAQMVNLTSSYGMPSTFEERDIYAIKISDNVGTDEDEPSILIVSAHHCREIVTPVLALHAIEQFTSLYGVDPAVTDAVDNYEIWISPVWNPDGYNEVFTGDNLWRKNRTIFPTGIGVDLNRNYDIEWDTTCGGSTSVNSQTYRGPFAASEAETQLMQVFSEDRHFAKIIDYHSSGREALYSYASFCTQHHFDDYLRNSATALSTASGYFGDIRYPSANGEHYEWQLNRYSSFAFLIETHTTFQPAFSSAQGEAQTVWPGILWMAELPIPLSGHVRSLESAQPLNATLTLDAGSAPNGETLRTRPLNGRFHLFVPPGQYDVTFTAEGYEPQTHTVTITTEAQNLEVSLALESGCRGDLTGNELVSVLDIVQVVNALGQSGGPEDIDGDGTVTTADLNLMVGNWGGCVPDAL